MWRRIWQCWLAMVVLLAPLAVHAAPPPPRLVMAVSEEWDDYTMADGTGMGWDILRKVFEPAGFKLHTETQPYTRAVGLVQKGEADVWVGSYKDETQSLYPRWNYDTDHIYALGQASRPVPTLATIGEYRLAWVRSYEFQRYLPNIRHYTEVQRRTGILDMLEHGRADYYIDAKTEIQDILHQAGDPKAYTLTHIAELPLYIGFSDTARGRELRDVFDRRMDELVPSGELRPIFTHWKQPYPFEAQTQVQGQ
jgi:ABC-type amino acid transport substrate-binding protein